MALDRAHPISTIYRSTTGQAIALRYDRISNTIEFVEDDWAAEGFRAGIAPRSVAHERAQAVRVFGKRSR